MVYAGANLIYCIWNTLRVPNLIVSDAMLERYKNSSHSNRVQNILLLTSVGHIHQQILNKIQNKSIFYYKMANLMPTNFKKLTD